MTACKSWIPRHSWEVKSPKIFYLFPIDYCHPYLLLILPSSVLIVIIHFPRRNHPVLRISLLRVNGTPELKRSFVLISELLGLSRNRQEATEKSGTRRRGRKKEHGLCLGHCGRIDCWDRIGLRLRLLREHPIQATLPTGKNLLMQRSCSPQTKVLL